MPSRENPSPRRLRLTHATLQVIPTDAKPEEIESRCGAADCAATYRSGRRSTLAFSPRSYGAEAGRHGRSENLSTRSRIAGFSLGVRGRLGVLLVVLFYAIRGAFCPERHDSGADGCIRPVGSGREFAAWPLLLHVFDIRDCRGRLARPMGREIHHPGRCRLSRPRDCHVRPRHRVGGGRRPLVAGRWRSFCVRGRGLLGSSRISGPLSGNGRRAHAVSRDARGISGTIRRRADDPRTDQLAAILALCEPLHGRHRDCDGAGDAAASAIRAFEKQYLAHVCTVQNGADEPAILSLWALRRALVPAHDDRRHDLGFALSALGLAR